LDLWPAHPAPGGEQEITRYRDSVGGTERDGGEGALLITEDQCDIGVVSYDTPSRY
jgi:hypothetical protein